MVTYVFVVGPTRVLVVSPAGVSRSSKPFISRYVEVEGREGLEVINELRGVAQSNVSL